MSPDLVGMQGGRAVSRSRWGGRAQKGVNASWTGYISRLGVDENLVDHKDRAVATDFE